MNNRNIKDILDLFTEVWASPTEPFVFILEAMIDPTKINSWPGPKRPLCTFPLRCLLSFFSRKTNLTNFRLYTTP